MADIEKSIVNNSERKKIPVVKKKKKRKVQKKIMQMPKKQNSQKQNNPPQKPQKNYPTLQLKNESEIALDFATKVYKKFDKMIKSVILFGSSVKQTAVAGSDIDIIIVLDDAMVKWDEELVAWYREELDKILKANPYEKDLHINTIKLSTWWDDLMIGDPVIINVLRYGEPVLDLAGFFSPLKSLLISGKIKSTPEAIYNCLQRAPTHFARSKLAELNTVEGLYWAMVDSAQAALMAANIPPASPEHISIDLKNTFVDTKKLNMRYVIWYRDLLFLHKKIAHGEIHDLKGVEIDNWQARTEDFMKTMAMLVKNQIGE
ncbi:MAG TPA: nucleotidyltransferase domain-containing protein [Patescibacteria group bacterium]|nr:nucleotidyltransferase domain-containing protein [Patescibacteria group bacterium]